MHFFIKRGNAGQGTVEAALFIPVCFVLLLLMLQPAIVLYDLIVMKGASAEACRLVATSDSGDCALVDDFLRRRLSAIPQAEIFHAHEAGCSYEIETEGFESSFASVTVKNKLKPLPLIDVALRSLGATGSDGLLSIEASSSQQVQPSWVG